MNATRILALGLGAWCLGLALGATSPADEPLPPPEKKEVWSGNHFYCAVMEPRSNLTTVYFVDGPRRKKLWTMLGWFRVAYLAGDGEHLVVGCDGGNLVPLDVREDDVMAYFVHKGEVVATLTMRDLVQKKSSLKRTASHFHWGSYLGIDEDLRFRVETVEGRKLHFDARTGKPVSMNGS